MSSPGNNSTHVLIVSMHGDARRFIEEGLKTAGYVTSIAGDGEAALAILKQRPINVVITSLDLYGMSGTQLCRAITRIFPHMPVIMMSQHPDHDQVTQVLSSGASDMASEMASPEEMHLIIQRNLERKASAARRIVTDRADILFKAIRAMAAAVDAKSHFAARYSGHVTQLSLMTAARLDLSPQEMTTLELAAQMHDIGKIGTPEKVLTKPDVLTDEEWVDVLKHPALGSAFLAVVPELSGIASIIRHHHEHYDGTGYPDGLQGEAIPLLSRIIAVADAYDAMISERPYRQAMGHEQAAEELERNSGTQFDATIVNHMLAALGEDKEERKAA